MHAADAFQRFQMRAQFFVDAVFVAFVEQQLPHADETRTDRLRLLARLAAA